MKATNKETITRRKREHIAICLNEQVAGVGITTGLERVRFIHNALPEVSFREISLETEWLDKRLAAPLLVSSMTGGTDEAGAINRRLAVAAEERGWAIGLGSMRAAIESEELASTFSIRKEAPSIPVIANLGAVQLNYGYGPDTCMRAVDIAEADALVLHLNSMQEVFQPEGDTDFKGLLKRIREVCRSCPVPVGMKEVGWGLDDATAALLHDAGVSFLDIAGAGGTSWSQVEKFRTSSPVQRAAAEAFQDWGIPTAESLLELRSRLPDAFLIASGGLQSGVDAAKTLALGANLAGFGRSLLPRAAGEDAELSVASLLEQFQVVEYQLRAAMFGIGAATVKQLRETKRISIHTP
ncbi:type 2 isopentenyl-diphosphate Delta-isomerase [Paenibacillus sp. J5C_2022]|uniref:type 2 isopentenyl-diphosphate Delta-isomerase n=1 Tax=Paenibacillus sp. J5C2022 TaxID=2977129 RepID=UPI0021CE1EE7|nr:type 2 isopentenyl-diphosphate Delta-isomerase [Paenibacillus sp. J5C2022]MCU6712454.1 type 2 isopentenyl-diphosphate Delta-isomerase [Paenibacillus sp. J5C2022]